VFRALFDFEDGGLFDTVSGEAVCDLSDHYALWGWLDYRQGSARAVPACPLPVLEAG
jgi:hypothetical protein